MLHTIYKVYVMCNVFKNQLINLSELNQYNQRRIYYKYVPDITKSWIHYNGFHRHVLACLFNKSG